MAASTAEGLKGQIAAAKRELEEKTTLTQQLDSELQKANERQCLRRDLDRIKKRIALREDINLDKKVERDMIDRDMCGDHLPQGGYHIPGANKICTGDDGAASFAKNEGQVMNCSEIVAKGEYVWRIEGLSWLENTLKQNGLCYASSEPFTVGGETFAFVYNPSGGKVSLTAEEQHGSLAIIHEDDDGITFRYRIFIKKKGGEFVQWGNTGDECHPTTDTCGWAFGPDVYQQDWGHRSNKVGIFGLSHKQLLSSEWVENDSLTVKFELEVRPDDWYGRAPLKPHVDVPQPTISADMRALLDEGKCSDVTFLVNGEIIKAHSPILCARSEVFEKQLTTGLRESTSKEIIIADCEVATFKALLQFLYTDSFTGVEELVKSITTPGATPGEDSPHQRLSLLQGLLAASHKYQVKRLRLWCEQQLCESITVLKVCDVLCQAHLYEAKQLEKACLSFIKNHMEEVVVTSSFGQLGKDWPQVMMKISIFTAGVSEARASPAIDAFEGKADTGKKRKQPES